MRKSVKIILSLSLVCSLLIPQIALAQTNESNLKEINTSQTTIGNTSDYEEIVKTKTTGKLVGKTEKYVKFTYIGKISNENNDLESFSAVQNHLSPEEISENLIVEEYTREEYDAEMLKEQLSKRINSSTKGIGSLEQDPVSWMALNMDVYESSASETDYQAIAMFNWLKTPFFTFEDAVGIYTSDGLIISKDPTDRYARYYHDSSGSSQSTVDNLYVERSKYSNGVMAKSKLLPSSLYHNFLISTGIAYNSTDTNKGWIHATYMHKEIGLGDITFDKDGKPSAGPTVKVSEHNGGIYVSR